MQRLQIETFLLQVVSLLPIGLYDKIAGFCARNLLLLRALIIAIFCAILLHARLDDKKITRSLQWLVNKMGSH